MQQHFIKIYQNLMHVRICIFMAHKIQIPKYCISSFSAITDFLNHPVQLFHNCLWSKKTNKQASYLPGGFMTVK